MPARRYLVACSRAPHTPPPLPAPTTSVVRLRWIRAGIGRRPLLAAVVSLPSTWSQLEARYGELPASTPAPEPAALRAYGRDSRDLLSAMAVPFIGGAR
ncbi:MAG: hypothetical protein IPH07_23775 [Deltaproteobacteria bacterium]|nr:hypothetical protein [Deltaproteobacteria bacterium]